MRAYVAVVIVAMLVWPARLFSQSVSVTASGGIVHVRAPGFRFIDGEALARLKDGRSVRVDLELTVLAKPGGAPAVQRRLTFILSYDLWEERFAAAMSGTPPRSVSHLSPAAAEAWCVQQLDMPVSALGALAQNLPFWVRLESRMLNGGRERDDDGFTLRGLIDALSRLGKAGELSRSIEAGPFRVHE
jgi:hypothetical protein